MGRYKKLTLLHSNDMHGDFHAEMTDNTLIGGVSMLSGYVNKVRREEKNVLYCIAGDMFRGSVIDSEYKGISTIEIMNAISPDVVSLGNHQCQSIHQNKSYTIVQPSVHQRNRWDENPVYWHHYRNGASKYKK